MGVLEQDIQIQLHQLKLQLEQTRLTQRDNSLRFKLEQKVLKRIVASLSLACKGEDSRLNQNLVELREALEQQKDVSILIPRLAVLERMLKKQTLDTQKQNQHLDEQVKHSGEVLLRIPGLPSKIKRDLRDLLSFSTGQSLPKVDQALRLLAIYERSIKIITTNPDAVVEELTQSADKEVLLKLNEELQLLITELDFEGESGDLLNDIRAKLLLGVSTQNLLELTLEVLKLVVAGTNYERKTSEKFLEQVNASLSSSLKSSALNVEQSHNYFEHRKDMHKELNSLVARSQTAVRDGTEINALKGTLNPLMSELASLSERLTLAEVREQALIERMDYTKNQMEALYEVTQDYRRRLEDQAQRMLQDPLTKVYNRTAFNDRIELEYRRWIRAQHNLRVVMLDIDKFKAINDSFGYAAGDKALKIIARTIKNNIEDTDTVARFSGEEFVLLLPERADSECYQIVQKIQRSISHLPFKFRDKNITITLSAASTLFKDSDSPEIVLERLHIALNNGKKFGPNQITWK
ncbi:GGDEF domain-containing protein [Vibrio ziniensis]|uniref:diguanylate cyclase n=1 Tax=Vibrio ziniensis TaxID=2711221 RepID=A0A6G7CGI8_9VIBR|nr:GGDEF domain-containing protein [Vibrio ziniensis]QIH41156.1 GGDEF domain-containing protein [Vibrio ziniensis]